MNRVAVNSIICIKDRKIIKTDFEGKEIKLDDFYKHIDCNCVDVLSIKGFDFWFDDEGKLKDGWQDRISIALIDGKTNEVLDVIVGNCVICKAKGSRSVPLSQKDTDKLLDTLGKTHLFNSIGNVQEVFSINVN